MSEILPARILLQIREGVVNEIVSFDIEVAKTVPHEGGDEGTLDHSVDVLQIVNGLAKAQKFYIDQVRSQVSPKKFEETLAWLRKTNDWAVSA